VARVLLPRLPSTEGSLRAVLAPPQPAVRANGVPAP
jgi:hypothetical protein